VGFPYPVGVAQGALTQIAEDPVERYVGQEHHRGHYASAISGNRDSGEPHEEEAHQQKGRLVVVCVRASEDRPHPVLGQIVPAVPDIFDDTAVQAL